MKKVEDWDEVSDQDYGFLRAVYGHVVPPSESSLRWVEGHEGAMRACGRAAEMLLRFRVEPRFKGQRGRNWVLPDTVVQSYLDEIGNPRGGYSYMSEVVHWLARHDTRYWGVEDTKTEWYCSYCDSKSSAMGTGAIPRSRFTICEWKCDKHAK